MPTTYSIIDRELGHKIDFASFDEAKSAAADLNDDGDRWAVIRADAQPVIMLAGLTARQHDFIRIGAHSSEARSDWAVFDSFEKLVELEDDIEAYLHEAQSQGVVGAIQNEHQEAFALAAVERFAERFVRKLHRTRAAFPKARGRGWVVMTPRGSGYYLDGLLQEELRGQPKGYQADRIASLR